MSSIAVTVRLLFLLICCQINSAQIDQQCVDFVTTAQAPNSCQCDIQTRLCQCRVLNNSYALEPCIAAMAIEDISPDNNFELYGFSRQVPDVPVLNMTNYNPFLGIIRQSDEPMSHIGRLPTHPNAINTRFLLFDNLGRSDFNLMYTNQSSFTRLREGIQGDYATVYIIAHGFNDNIRTERDYRLLRERLFIYQSLLRISQVAVIYVDWSVGAASLPRRRIIVTQAVLNTAVVGREVAAICRLLVVNRFVTNQNIHLVGYGLGAQVMHFAGRWFSEIYNQDTANEASASLNSESGEIGRPIFRVGRITGLDPFARHFQGYINGLGVVPHLSRGDATFVDIIHTSAVLDNGKFPDMVRGRFGMSTPSSTTSFYPNGGIKQPGCGGINRLRITCSHRKALHYFINSLTSETEAQERFQSIRARDWRAYRSIFLRNIATSVPLFTSYMGIAATDGLGFGVQFLAFQTDRDLNFVESDVARISFEGDDLVFIERSELGIQVPIPNPGPAFDRFPIHDQSAIQTVQLDTTRNYPACGAFVTQSPGRSVNAYQAYLGQFPWTICLIRYDTTVQIWKQSCSGSIINDEFVITAAHCFYDTVIENGEDVEQKDEEGTPFYMAYGSTDCQRPLGFKRLVINYENTVFIHPKYEETFLFHDVALIKLLDPIVGLPRVVYSGESINSICWDNLDMFDYTDCNEQVYFSGFGVIEKNGVTEQMTWLPMRKGLQSNFDEQRAQVGTTTFHNREQGVYRAPGSGDSGGPFMWYIRPEGQEEPTPGVSPFRALLIGTEMRGSLDIDPVQGWAAKDDVASRVGGAVIHSWIVDILTTKSQTVIQPGIIALQIVEATDWALPVFEFPNN